mgnify:CR=1 FL=1
MLDSLVSSIEKAFVEFSARRLVYVVFLFAIAFGGLWLFNRATGYGPFTRLERQVSTLERLQTLEAKGIDRSAALSPLYRETVRQLSLAQAAPIAPQFDPEPVVKVAAATAIPLLFVLVGVLQILAGKSEAVGVAGGAMVFAILLGVPSLFVPTLWGSLKVTALVIFGVQAVAIAVVVAVHKRRNKRAA